MRLTFIATALVLLSGCTAQAVKDARDAEDARQQVLEVQNERIEDHLDSLPDWVITPPKPDGINVYAVGLADSTDLQTAIKKATLEGEFGLANQINQEISGSERAYNVDTAGVASNRYEGLIDKLIDQVPIVGYSVEERQIEPREGKYSVALLLKLPLDEFNTALKQLRSKQQSQDMKAAFDDLERRLDKRRQERAGTAQHQIQQSATVVQTAVE